jgi:hypothetical protein
MGGGGVTAGAVVAAGAAVTGGIVFSAQLPISKTEARRSMIVISLRTIMVDLLSA